MKFCFFGSMSYGRLREPVLSWPVPNEQFEPEQALRARDACFSDYELADELGFDWVSVAEHHYSPNSLAPSINVLAAALSQRVHSAKLAVLGPLLPLGNPVRIAEEIAMLDNLCSGRVIVALLRGAPYEYLVYNVDPEESRTRFEEAWDLIYRSWTDTQPFGWEGRHYHFRNVSIWPRPVQQPTPPIIASGSSRDSGDFAARKRIALGLAFTNLPLASEAARFYREKAEEYGWQPQPEHVLYRLNAYVAENDDRAFADMREQSEGRGAAGGGGGIMNANRLVAASGFFGQRDANLTQRFQNLGEGAPHSLEDAVRLGTLLCGGPSSVIEQVARLREEIGCGIVEVSFAAPKGSTEAKHKAMTLFAREVAPALRDLN
jgi:alkanesulfonate monooxygenase SsuD/methylene tetrahydromethanopterin reductase-like flavin-dependent oxidoreductase (luciferase family)